MLLQDELVAQALTASGQVFVEPHMLEFTDERIARDILVPCAEEFKIFRPPVVWEHLMVHTQGWIIPRYVRRVLGLRPLWLYYWAYTHAAVALRPIPRMEASKWFITEGVLYAPPGRYEVEYISANGYTVTHDVPEHAVYEPSPDEGRIEFRLRARIRPGTLKLRTGGTWSESYSEGYLEAVDDGNGRISGSFVDTGVVDYETNLVSLSLSQPLGGPLRATFFARNPGVKELDFKDVWFVDLFASKFLPAFAAARSLVAIPGLPVDLNNDGLLDYARQKQTDWLTVRHERNAWWRW